MASAISLRESPEVKSNMVVERVDVVMRASRAPLGNEDSTSEARESAKVRKSLVGAEVSMIRRRSRGD